MLSIFKSIPTYMDYGGQKLAEQIFQGITLVFAIVGFIYGMIVQQFGWTVYIVLTGFTISCLLTLPPWPIYRKNPLTWLPALPESPGDTRDKAPENQKKPRKHK